MYYPPGCCDSLQGGTSPLTFARGRAMIVSSSKESKCSTSLNSNPTLKLWKSSTLAPQKCKHKMSATAPTLIWQTQEFLAITGFLCSDYTQIVSNIFLTWLPTDAKHSALCISLKQSSGLWRRRVAPIKRQRISCGIINSRWAQIGPFG